jgi:hypothetical protein
MNGDTSVLHGLFVLFLFGREKEGRREQADE